MSFKRIRRMLEENGIRQSMSQSRCPYDNACSESFFATAKKECIYLKNYATIHEVKRDIFEYIESNEKIRRSFFSIREHFCF